MSLIINIIIGIFITIVLILIILVVSFKDSNNSVGRLSSDKKYMEEHCDCHGLY